MRHLVFCASFLVVISSSADRLISAAGRLAVDSVTVRRAITFISLPARGLRNPAYEGSARQAHPSVIRVSGSWPHQNQSIHPWGQWLAVTPIATADTDENPHLFARNDDDDEWTYLIGRDSADSIINPLFDKRSFILDTAYWFCTDTDTAFYDTTNGKHDSVTLRHPSHHLSDPDLILDDQERLVMVFRVSWCVSGVDMHAIYAARTLNGRDWEQIGRLTHLGRFMSPAIVRRDENRFLMFCTAEDDPVSGVVKEGGIYRFEGDASSPGWVCDGSCRITDTPREFGTPWHIEVIPRTGSEWIAIVQTVRSSALWLAASYDRGETWQVAGRPFLESCRDSTLWDAILYRASGYWTDDNRTRLTLIYSGYCVWDTNGVAAGGQVTRWHTGETVVTFPVSE